MINHALYYHIPILRQHIFGLSRVFKEMLKFVEMDKVSHFDFLPDLCNVKTYYNT
jgi:hypothetical protein